MVFKNIQCKCKEIATPIAPHDPSGASEQKKWNSVSVAPNNIWHNHPEWKWEALNPQSSISAGRDPSSGVPGAEGQVRAEGYKVAEQTQGRETILSLLKPSGLES